MSKSLDFTEMLERNVSIFKENLKMIAANCIERIGSSIVEPRKLASILHRLELQTPDIDEVMELDDEYLSSKFSKTRKYDHPSEADSFSHPSAQNLLRLSAVRESMGISGNLEEEFSPELGLNIKKELMSKSLNEDKSADAAKKLRKLQNFSSMVDKGEKSRPFVSPNRLSGEGTQTYFEFNQTSYPSVSPLVKSLIEQKMTSPGVEIVGEQVKAEVASGPTGQHQIIRNVFNNKTVEISFNVKSLHENKETSQSPDKSGPRSLRESKMSEIHLPPKSFETFDSFSRTERLRRMTLQPVRDKGKKLARLPADIISMMKAKVSRLENHARLRKVGRESVEGPPKSESEVQPKKL